MGLLERWRRKWNEYIVKVELWRFPDEPEKRVLSRAWKLEEKNE